MKPLKVAGIVVAVFVGFHVLSFAISHGRERLKRILNK
jgi:hypothetical protein